MRATIRAAAAALLLMCVSVIASAAGKPADELAGVIKLLMLNAGGDWAMIEDVKPIKWAALPPKSLDNCLPDGGCFTRAGTLAPGGQPMAIKATGARSIVVNFYIKNSGAPIGEVALIAALGAAGLAPQLARCPVNPNDPVHYAKWWHVTSGAMKGFVSYTHSSDAKAWEGIGYHGTEDLPPLQPNEVKAYSEKCAAKG